MSIEKEVALPHVAICVHVDSKNLDLLDECLSSINRQDYTNRSIAVLVHKASLDKTHEICEGNHRASVVYFDRYTSEEDQRKQIVNSLKDHAHVFGFIYANDIYIENDVLSNVMLHFINFPQNVGIVQLNYLLEVEKDIFVPQIEVYNNHYYISSLCLQVTQSNIPSFLNPLQLPRLPHPLILARYNELGFKRKMKQTLANVASRDRNISFVEAA